MSQSKGNLFRNLIKEESPLQILGTINAYSALLAEKSGAKAIYLSGAGVANASYGIPDLGMTTLDNVLEDIRRITAITDLPLLVDADTGWDSASKTAAEFSKAGAAAMHIEDQVSAKRCGHRPNKQLIPTEEMCDRIKASADGRCDDNFVIMARTDSHASEGLEAAIERSLAYVESGADMIFAEAIYTLDEYRAFTEQVKAPVLANITEFGKTPLFTKEELKSAGISMILYPLSAFRAMSAATLSVYSEILNSGTQKNCLDSMQTRAELYDVLNYMDYEKKLDEMFSKQKDQQ